MSDNNTKTEIIEYDIEKIKKGFSLWIDKWEHSLIEIEFNDPYERGIVTRTEDDDSLGYRFTTEFNFSIKKRKKEDEEKEKQYNKTHGVEITETFPFPILEEDQDTEGNK